MRIKLKLMSAFLLAIMVVVCVLGVTAIDFDFSNSLDSTSKNCEIEIIKSFNAAGAITDGDLTDTQREQIEFTATGPNGYTKTFSYADFTEGVFVLKDLAAGTYTIQETNGSLSGYRWSVVYSDAGGTVTTTSSDGPHLIIVNTYTEDGSTPVKDPILNFPDEVPPKDPEAVYDVTVNLSFTNDSIKI